jgi:hypothetical protein
MMIGVGLAAEQELVRAGIAVIVVCQEDMMVAEGRKRRGRR